MSIPVWSYILIVAAGLLSAQARAELHARDLDGHRANAEAWYDSELNITWLAQTHGARGTAFDDGNFGDGMLSWNQATAWVAQLDLGGATGWRLPAMTDLDPPGCDHFQLPLSDCGYNVDPAHSELAHMFHVTLGNRSADVPGGGLVHRGPFGDLDGGLYWTGTSLVTHPQNAAWAYIFGIGAQEIEGKSAVTVHAWAVHEGDVGRALEVPEPPVAWLWCCALLLAALHHESGRMRAALVRFARVGMRRTGHSSDDG